MYCGKCGSPMGNDAVFCPRCGEKSQTLEIKAVPSGKRQAPAFLGMIAGIMAVVIILVLLFSDGGYKKPLNLFFKAIEKQDVELMLDKVYAEYYIAYADNGWAKGVAYDWIESALENYLDDWDCGDKIKTSYKILDKKRATKEILERLEEEAYDNYACFGFARDEYSISAAYLLDVSFDVKGNEAKGSFRFNDGLLFIKENGKWRYSPKDLISDYLWDEA